MKREASIPASLVEKSGPNSSEEYSGKGAADLTPTGAQESDPVDMIARTLVLPWGTRHNREHIREVAEHIDAEIRPVHYREAADSLDKLGHTAAARAVRSAAKDLEDGE